MNCITIIPLLLFASACTADTFSADASDDGDPPDAMPDSIDPPDARTDGDPTEDAKGDALDGGANDVTLDAFDAPSTVSKRVFVTSAYYAPNLGGLSAADTACGSAAADAGLGGSWAAWLSSSTTSASTRLAHNGGQYKLTSGTVVASDWTGLTSGNLSHPIDHDEHGNAVSTSSGVWTGTTSSGATLLPTCQDWTATSGSGEIGIIGGKDGGWTESMTFSCGSSYALYCVEQ